MRLVLPLTKGHFSNVATFLRKQGGFIRGGPVTVADFSMNKMHTITVSHPIQSLAAVL